MIELHGIIPPIATPMLDNEDLDLPRFRWFLDYLLSEGVYGLFVLGTNSEFYALTEDEKQAVMATAVQHVRGRAPVIAGVGATTTREVLRLVRIAEREQVNAVSVITPYFISPTQHEILTHYRRIAESTSLPVMLYNNPATCNGVRIEPETLARLAELPNVVAVKDSSGDLQNTMEYLRLAPPRFAVFQGRDTLIYPSLELGCRGAVPASANVAPRLCVEIYEAFRRGDREASKEAQWRLNPVRLSLGLATAPAGVKAALALLGKSIGPCRAPVSFPTGEKLELMRRTLASAGLITA
ncbi:MAG: 4-hydroxy-tetrahydrodipicolinate synthase [Gemmatales bacterium]|nr:4-hydroxy-tetrahydrodipicolinate synthase [Gemmatales bacterium]MDW7995586.1 4-hydroxy-tetrahydrodipicolinate synthase [Gemmatales bacterium]